MADEVAAGGGGFVGGCGFGWCDIGVVAEEVLADYGHKEVGFGGLFFFGRGLIVRVDA